jgi:hypothetical protein
MWILVTIILRARNWVRCSGACHRSEESWLLKISLAFFLLSSSWDPYRDCISHTSIAASDRTVVTLTFPLHNLLANRHCWIRLLRNPLEISIPRRDDQSIFLDDTIPWCRHSWKCIIWLSMMLIYVVLRLPPAVTSNLQREVPEEGMMIAGYFVPGPGVCRFLILLI